MLLIVPVHLNRISPVADVARQFLLLELDAQAGPELRRSEVRLHDTEPLARARALAELEPQVLICGAISRSFETLLASSGVRVIPNTCGPVDEVIAAFVAGQLTDDAFLMPGCARRGLRYRGGRSQ
jgi:predicted Fe-Mo cluster-binding NifX family protein